MWEAHGWLTQAIGNSSWLLLLASLLASGFLGAPLFVWTIVVVVGMWIVGVPAVIVAVVAVPFVLMNIKPLRSALVSRQIMTIIEKLKLMPVISETERVALEAGSTWVDAELFSGRPDFDRIRKEPYARPSAEEQAFIDNQVEKVCSMVSDWEIFNKGDLPEEVWAYLKKEKFLGMIVPKEYGGLGFSAVGHSEVIAKLGTHSTPLCVSVMVPNSLGPAELLAHYGTKEQKQHYLPRLADGLEIPCFALTEPNAGSDAGSITSSGVVFKGEDGKLYVKLNWDKRYITLAAVATLIGLAIKLRDPDNLLGKGKEPGITCVLVPAGTKGVVLGRRHNPMGVPFYNCPTTGHDVVVSVDQIIGGPDGAGRGWQMLMESLSAGRSISLPSQAAGGAKFLTRLTSGYSAVRRQFGLQIGHFEGVEEPLARVTALTYLMEAARLYTVGAVDNGLKPAVVSAIAKYNQTELARKLMNDGMDILGGAAISRGPRNRIANAYIGIPISITVEGANILTRCMIIFGQGAIRCHPFAYREVKAMQDKDLKEFDSAFWGHIGHVVRNTCRSVVLSASRGWLAKVPSGPGAQYYRKLAWASASFSIMSDIAMGTLGGKLKLKEKLTGRYADILSWMYLASATLRRFEAEGFRKDHEDVFHWSMQYAMARIQEAFDGIFANFEGPVVGPLFRSVLASWSRINTLGKGPNDELGHKIARAIQVPGEFRDSLTTGIITVAKEGDTGDILERAFKLCYESEAILKRIQKASRKKLLPKKRATLLVREAVAAKIITEEEAKVLDAANIAREEAIKVDSFSLEEFRVALMEVGSTPEKVG
jgi:acyl-CoA dehydrogenase